MPDFHALLAKDDKTQAEILLVQAIATLSTQPAFAALTPEDVYAKIWEYAFPAPATLYFFDNGQTMAGDAQGHQMPRYQGRHKDVLAQLAADGIELMRVGEILGSPETPIAWVRPTPELLGSINLPEGGR